MAEANLNILIKNMNPSTDNQDYVFCTSPSLENPPIEDIICIFQEKEGLTLILKKEIADAHGFLYEGIFGWITLNVESSLEAIGLTARFAEALARENISCNVIAGYYHDHIFVQKHLLEKSIQILLQLSHTIE